MTEAELNGSSPSSTVSKQPTDTSPTSLSIGQMVQGDKTDQQKRSTSAPSASTDISSLASQVEATSDRVASMQTTLEQLSTHFKEALQHSGPPSRTGSQTDSANGHLQLSQEFRATLESLQRVLSVIAFNQSQASSKGAPTSTAVGERPRLGLVINSHAKRWAIWGKQAVWSVAAQADDVATALARRILIEPPHHRSAELEIAADSAPDTLLSRGRARLIMGAACFVAIVELAWQLHFRLAERLSARLQKAGAPARAGLRILRGAVWAAAILLTARATRRSCFQLADATCDSLCRVLEQKKGAYAKDAAEDDGIQHGDFPSGACESPNSALGSEK